MHVCDVQFSGDSLYLRDVDHITMCKCKIKDMILGMNLNIVCMIKCHGLEQLNVCANEFPKYLYNKNNK